MKTPLAWRNLTVNLRRLALALASIGFVVLLMFMEIGFLNGCFDSSTYVYEKFDADLLIISRGRTAAYAGRFPRTRLYQACDCPAVKRAIPMYVMAGGIWKLPDSGRLRRIRVFGFDVHEPAFRLPEGAPLAELQVRGTALFDSDSRDLFGQPGIGTVAEVNRRNVRIVGLVPMGIDLDTDGSLLVDHGTFFAIFGDARNGGLAPSEVDYGLVQLHPGAELAVVQRDLRDRLAPDVKILTLPEYIEEVHRYWSRHTAVGFLFHIGVFVGLIIGVVVCYQILFTDISNNLLPFATLKAMGYGNGYLVKIVLQQASLLGLLGFVLGAVGAFFLYRLLQWGTGLIMVLTVPRLASILSLTLGMCLVAGLMALNKVIQTDPADCF